MIIHNWRTLGLSNSVQCVGVSWFLILNRKSIEMSFRFWSSKSKAGSAFLQLQLQLAVSASLCFCVHMQQFNTCWSITTCATVFVADLLIVIVISLPVALCVFVSWRSFCHVAESKHFCLSMYFIFFVCTWIPLILYYISPLVLVCEHVADSVWACASIRRLHQRLSDDMQCRSGPLLDWSGCSFPRGCRLNCYVSLSVSLNPPHPCHFPSFWCCFLTSSPPSLPPL